MHHKKVLSKLEKEQMLDSYMKTTIKNACKEFYRNLRRERGNVKEVPIDEFTEDLSASDLGEEDLFPLLFVPTNNSVDRFTNHFFESISDDILFNTLQRMTDKQIKVLLLRCLVNFKFDMIAELCETSESSAKKINGVAKSRLFKLYANKSYCEELFD